MAWRVEEENVRELLQTDTTIPVRPFIVAANALTDYVVTQDSESLLNTAMLFQIEQYLAAHFYALKDAQFQKVQTGDASATLQGKTDLKLDLTWWGQMAQVFDVTGTLANLSKQVAKAGGGWLGKRPSQQTDYEDRD